ncbi:hypothetical protein [Faecalispora anaeroviscerum]|uniref:hypothetical protein n=1 Tax=Faecalispora anaeroviscerum TaxID=2991836 RepID=UPI0024BA29D5|nr:hypothetical protein [Faecalispora anaeroviscerum]
MLDHKLLEQMVLKVIRQLEEERLIQLPQQKVCYLLLPERWQSDTFEKLGSLLLPGNLQAIFVLPKIRYNDFYIQKLKALFPGSLVLEQEQAWEEQRDEFITVFPFPNRALVAKTALCLEDSFETRWIGRCFSLGQKVVMLSSGMEPFSGKEPKAYRIKIEQYIRTLTDFGIKLTDRLTVPQPYREPALNPEPEKNMKKRVITEADLALSLTEGRLVLHQGDIVTMLAKEKAAEMGIQIIRG